MDLKEKKVLVFGSGISGVAASRLLLQVGARVVLYDGNTSLDAKAVEEQVLSAKPALSNVHFRVILGELPADVRESLALVVMSPGVPTDLPVVDEMRAGGIPIWGEIELAYTFAKGDVLAITGTNGKTTTTTLLGEIMKQYCHTYVVGNIGNPYTEIALDMTEQSVAVAEMSSFQLETIHKFRPKVSAVLNITPDHLNRHHTMEGYIAAKKQIFRDAGISIPHSAIAVSKPTVFSATVLPPVLGPVIIIALYSPPREMSTGTTLPLSISGCLAFFSSITPSSEISGIDPFIFAARFAFAK